MNSASIQKSLTYLRSEIQSGTWSKKERLPPVRILARHAQVSAAAMCSALAVLKEEGLVSIVKNRGAYLGPSPEVQKGRASTVWSGGQRWQRLKTQIEAAIFSGYYAAGEPMPSLRDLEKNYSVSYKTLHKALESIAEEGLIVPWKKTYSVPPLRKAHATLAFISVAGASSTLSYGGYPHTEFLSALRREGEKSLINIGQCVYHPDRSSVDFTNQLRALREKHPILGYVLWTSRLPERKLGQLIQILREETQSSHEKSGMDKPLAIVDTVSDNTLTQFFQQTLDRETPAIRIFGVAGVLAGRQVGQYLLKLGHRKVAFLSYYHKELSSQNRYRGLLQAFQGAGRAEDVVKFTIDDIEDRSQVLSVAPEIGEYLSQAQAFLHASAEKSRGHYASYALEQMQASVANYIHQLKIVERVEPTLDAILEQPGITACVAANDRMALMVRDHLARKGLRIPRDMAIIGFDDSKAATDKDITSYSFAFPDMARKVLTYILATRPKQSLREDSFAECEGLLIERGSSGPARTESVPAGVVI